MSKSNYDILIYRDRITVLRRGCLCTPALIEYDTMPERFRMRFEEKYGNPHTMLKAGSQAIIMNEEAREFFAGFVLPSGKHLSAEKIMEYTLNASVLDSLRMEYEGQRLARRSAGRATKISWEGILARSEEIRKYKEHDLPSNENRLRDKLMEYMGKGFECLIHHAHGTASARKITEDGGRLLIALRRSNHPVYDMDDILKKYNEVAAEKGWETLKSTSTIKKYLERPEIWPKWYAAVYGELAAKQKYDRMVRTKMPLRRDSLWYGDGTKLNLYYMGVNRNGKPALCTLYVYEVVDAYSEMLLGYAIGTHETAALQREAFRRAVEFAGHKPFEVVIDNQGGQKTDESKAFMSQIGRVIRFTAPHQPQAKSIESIFGRFQKKVLKKDIFFTGLNITSKSKDSKARMEYIEANKDKCYTCEEVREAYARYREVWNDMPYPATRTSRRDRYYASENLETKELTEFDKVELFWNKTTATFTSLGIEIQVDGVKYAYEVLDDEGNPDYEFRERNTGREFIVKYDPEDLSSYIWLYKDTSVGACPVTKAKPYLTVHRAIQDQTPQDQDVIRANVEANKRARIRRQIEGYEIEAEFGVAPEQHGFRTPKLAGVSKRDQERLYDAVIINEHVDDDGMDADCVPLTEGERQKQISGMVYSDIDYQILNKF